MRRDYPRRSLICYEDIDFKATGLPPRSLMSQQRFTPEFEDEAVRQVTERGHSVQERREDQKRGPKSETETHD